jgi:hypothetical protein
MTRITNADQVLLLLRERLQRLDKGRSGRTGRAKVEQATPRPVARLQTLAAAQNISEDEFRRTLVLAVLSEELGESFANDPAFRAIADDVFRVISESGEGRELIDRAATRIKGG